MCPNSPRGVLERTTDTLLSKSKKLSPSRSLWASMVVMFLNKAGTLMLDTTIRPYTNLAVCRQMFPSNMSFCSGDDFTSQQERQIQSTAASYLIYYRVLQYVPSIILGPFLGAWSDKSGRVLPILVSTIGHVLAVPVYIISWDFPEYSLELFLTGSALQGVFCTTFLFNMAVNAFVAENVSTDDRTKTLSFLMAMQLLGQMAGSLLAGIFQDFTSFQTTICATSVFQTCAVLTTIICIRERFATDKSDMSTSGPVGLKESIRVILKSRKGSSRCIILVLCVLAGLNSFCYTGDTDITPLYVQGKPLQWPESWYGYYCATVQCSKIVFLFCIGPILFPKFSDLCIMQIAILLGLLKCIMMTFSVVSWMMWMSAGIDFMSGVTLSITRSLLSKEVETDELGKMYSLLGILDMTTRPAASAAFASIYANTLNFFPGMAYLVQGFGYILYFIFARVVYKLNAQSG